MRAVRKEIDNPNNEWAAEIFPILDSTTDVYELVEDTLDSVTYGIADELRKISTGIFENK